MKEILESWKRFLNESSLSRVYGFIQTTDTAIISAFRDDPLDRSKCEDAAVEESGEEGTTFQVNRRRSRDLKAAMLSLKYGVTKVRGSYIEDFDTPQAVEVTEESFFVVNLEEDPNFMSNIKRLGEKFCQDSVLIIPKGGQGAHLFGTNDSEFPGYGQKIEVGSLKMGEESEFMTRVNKRPLTFTEGLETYKNLSRNERMAVKNIAKVILS